MGYDTYHQINGLLQGEINALNNISKTSCVVASYTLGAANDSKMWSFVGGKSYSTASPVNTGTASRDHCSKQDYK